ncbi:aldo/keto reductase [Pilatotrama ljubarskyi]|nr:aldo/keto reductase [Pilatotrama ljubarskyi]
MVKTTKLGGTAKDVIVAKVAHGLMTMTSIHPTPLPDEQTFESIKCGIDALPPGVKMMLNSAEFYGHGWTLGNLELLARFFEKYPEYAERTFLSVKGGSTGRHQISCKKEVLRQSVEKCIAALRGTKKIDLFQPARIDREVSVEDTMRTLVEMVREGKFDHIGLSECRADTLRRGHAVYPVSVVEIEISPMVYEDETKKVIATAAELDIAIAAYSPLAHGLTTGAVKSPQDMPGPFKAMTRVQGEYWDYTRRFAEAFADLARKKGCTPAQLSIAWVGSLGEKVIPLPGSSRKERTLENLYGGDIELSSEDQAEVARLMEENPVLGDRALGPAVDLKLWG